MEVYELKRKFYDYIFVFQIGFSIYGPGCSLPSRYIEFFSYIPWIKSHIKIPIATRRSGNKNIVKQIDPSSDIVSDSFFIEDDFYVTKLNDTTMVLEKGIVLY